MLISWKPLKCDVCWLRFSLSENRLRHEHIQTELDFVRDIELQLPCVVRANTNNNIGREVHALSSNVTHVDLNFPFI